jgi:hypothetical protein
MVTAAGSAGTEAGSVTEGEQPSGLAAEHGNPIHRGDAARSPEQHQAAQVLRLTGRSSPAVALTAAAENVRVLPCGGGTPRLHLC